MEAFRSPAKQHDRQTEGKQGINNSAAPLFEGRLTELGNSQRFQEPKKQTGKNWHWMLMLCFCV
jgi:putative transposon-encoded protein